MPRFKVVWPELVAAYRTAEHAGGFQLLSSNDGFAACWEEILWPPRGIRFATAVAESRSTCHRKTDKVDACVLCLGLCDYSLI